MTHIRWLVRLQIASIASLVLVCSLLVPAGASEGSAAPDHPVSAGRSSSPVQDQPGVGNVGHKGASRAAPENTLAAVHQAIAHQADFVGIDVRLTKDGVPVVLHDHDLRRTTDVERRFPHRQAWPVNAFTLQQVRRLDAGSWFSKAYSRLRIPTLAATLRALAASDTGAFLEVKSPAKYGGSERIGAVVVAALRKHTDWLDEDGRNVRLVVQSFSTRFLEAFSRDHPHVALGLLGVSSAEEMRRFPFATQINVHHARLTPALVRAAHSDEVAVSTWVVNSQARMAEVLALGVDAVSTDRPTLLRRVLVARDQVLDNGREPPPDTPVGSELTIDPAARAYARQRVPVAVDLTADDGEPARWQWVQIEVYRHRRWVRLQRRVTDVNGSIATTVTGRVGLRLRARSASSAWFEPDASQVHGVDVVRRPTEIRLRGPASIVDGRRARLEIRWRATNGSPVSGWASLWARAPDGTWAYRRRFRVSGGTAAVLVRPRRDTRYEVRGKRGWWWLPDQERHRVRVLR